ncbi:MAG: MiaB/RimO family radical SAM methylthiotransferase [Chloroflexi bacterium]|nr:MAG: MiaB/RimO family radical SAM methylthiotransferase [Chloroflexota bacterium]
MRRFLIETWGCQMNVHDSEKMAGILGPLGYEATADVNRADLILLNTCSVREKAAEKVFSRLGQLRGLKRLNPDLVIAVCGCVAQLEGETIFRRAPYVDLVMSTAARGAGPRAYVTVMEGCNKSCTYCIVPFTRGREVCRSAQEILAEVRDLVARGYPEIEFLGQNVNAYHHGTDELSSLLRMSDRIEGVRRLRFTTSHPGHLDHRTMDAMRDVPSVCNHLHLPAQSGSNRILRLMKRGYTRERYLQKISYLRCNVPRIAFSTDIIVGFPGETEEDFTETVSLLRDVEFDQVYAFAYSARPGTVAAGMTNALPEALKQERLQSILTIQEEIQLRRNTALVGRSFEILLDGRPPKEGPGVRGRTTCNRIVHVPADASTPNTFLTVRITRAHAHSLSGEPLLGSRAA